MIELSICIPTLDTFAERTQSCLRSLRSTLEGIAYEIVINDNGASPQGFTAPLNAALRASRGDYLVASNDDVIFLPGWWPPLKAALDSGLIVVFPQTVDGYHRSDFAGWCFAMTPKTRDEYSVQPGEFYDPRMVIWYQDTDLRDRMWRNGHLPKCVADSHIRHGLSQTLCDPKNEWVAEQIRKDEEIYRAG